MFVGDDVKRFLDWLEGLEVGGAIMATADEKAAGAAAAARASLRA